MPVKFRVRKEETETPAGVSIRPFESLPSIMSSIAKVTEIIASSEKSFEDAVRQGVKRASKTLDNVRSAWVQSQQVMVDGDGEISEYRVNLKVTFVLKG